RLHAHETCPAERDEGRSRARQSELRQPEQHLPPPTGGQRPPGKARHRRNRVRAFSKRLKTLIPQGLHGEGLGLIRAELDCEAVVPQRSLSGAKLGDGEAPAPNLTEEADTSG